MTSQKAIVIFHCVGTLNLLRSGVNILILISQSCVKVQFKIPWKECVSIFNYKTLWKHCQWSHRWLGGTSWLNGLSQASKQHRLKRYHSQTYVNGSKCDLNGNPRETEVRVRRCNVWCTSARAGRLGAKINSPFFSLSLSLWKFAFWSRLFWLNYKKNGVNYLKYLILISNCVHHAGQRNIN